MPLGVTNLHSAPAVAALRRRRKLLKLWASQNASQRRSAAGLSHSSTAAQSAIMTTLAKVAKEKRCAPTRAAGRPPPLTAGRSPRSGELKVTKVTALPHNFEGEHHAIVRSMSSGSL